MRKLGHASRRLFRSALADGTRSPSPSLTSSSGQVADKAQTDGSKLEEVAEDILGASVPKDAAKSSARLSDAENRQVEEK